MHFRNNDSNLFLISWHTAAPSCQVASTKWPEHARTFHGGCGVVIIFSICIVLLSFLAESFSALGCRHFDITATCHHFGLHGCFTIQEAKLLTLRRPTYHSTSLNHKSNCQSRNKAAKNHPTTFCYKFLQSSNHAHPYTSPKQDQDTPWNLWRPSGGRRFRRLCWKKMSAETGHNWVSRCESKQFRCPHCHVQIIPKLDELWPHRYFFDLVTLNWAKPLRHFWPWKFCFMQSGGQRQHKYQ